jgi:hypothetical protein
MKEFEFTIGQNISAADRTANFVTVTDIPFEDRSLGYSVLLPNTWGFDTIKAESAALPTDTLKPLSVFLGPGNKESQCFFQLFGMKMVRDVRAIHWYVNYAQKSEFKVLKTNELSHLFVDAIAEKEISGSKFLFRQVTRVDRDRLFFFQFLSPDSFYEDIQHSFGLGVASFQLDSEDTTKTVEPRSAFNLKNGLRFQLPSSWAKGGASEDGFMVDCVNTNANNEVAGWLRLQVLPAANEQELLDSVGKQLAKSGVRFGNQISEQGVGGEPIGSNKVGADHTFYAEIEGSDVIQEARFVNFPISDTETLAVSLVGPSRSHDFWGWAINQRGLEIACESLQIGEASQ